MSQIILKSFSYLKHALLYTAEILVLIISALAKLLYIIYEILIPRELRELVPILNMYRKYLIYVSNIFAEPKRKELLKLQEQIDELRMQEDKIHKAYPIQRGVGETYDHIVTFLLVVILPVFVWKRSLFEVINPLVFAIFLSTAMGILSWTATFFGPIYALFHRVSLRMVRMGAYGWGLFYQKLEDLFSLPYLASKSSFTVFDAPPIDKETFEDFKLSILNDVSRMKEKVRNILVSGAVPYTFEVRKAFQEFLEHHPNEALDMTVIEDAISRAFSLLIWKREKSILPWKNEKSLREFAKRNNMAFKEAKTAIRFVVTKLEDKFISKPFYVSILLTGALKGLVQVENRYNQKLEDKEYNQLAFSLALGAQRYIVDNFARIPLKKVILLKFRNFILGFFAPYIELFAVLIDYFRHIANTTKILFTGNWRRNIIEYFKMRKTEVEKALFSAQISEKMDRENEEGVKKEAKELLRALWLAAKFLTKVILALPFSAYYLAKMFFLVLKSIFKGEPQKRREQKEFEKRIVQETMVAMYEEIYDKFILHTYYYS